MYKKVALLLLFVAISGNIIAMNPDNQIADKAGQTSQLDTAKSAVEKELKKNKAELKKFKDNAKLAPVITKIEPILQKIVISEQFKAIIEEMTTKQAQDIASGKSLTDVKYDHSLSTEFSKLANVHPLLTKIYGFMANIEHYQLLLSKLNNPQPQTEQKTSDSVKTEESFDEKPEEK